MVMVIHSLCNSWQKVYGWTECYYPPSNGYYAKHPLCSSSLSTVPQLDEAILILNIINKWRWVCCYHNCTWFWWMLYFLDIHLFIVSLFKLAIFTKKLLLYYFRITSGQPQKQNPVVTSSQHHLHILTSSNSQSSSGTSGWGDNHTSSLLWS